MHRIKLRHAFWVLEGQRRPVTEREPLTETRRTLVGLAFAPVSHPMSILRNPQLLQQIPLFNTETHQFC